MQVEPGERPGNATLQRVPQRRVGGADRGPVVHQGLDLDVVGQVAQRLAQVGGDLVGSLAGQVRMSTSIVTVSGMTFVLVWPADGTLGENVVWVQA
jgi:hypothetical protein